MKGVRHLLCVASLPYSLASNVDDASGSVFLKQTTVDVKDMADAVLLLQTTVDVTATVDAGGVSGVIGARASSGYDVASTGAKAGNGKAVNDDTYAELGSVARRDAWRELTSDHDTQAVPAFLQQYPAPRLAHVSSDHGAQRFAAPRLAYAVGPDAAAYDEMGVLTPVQRQEQALFPTPRATSVELAQAGLEADLIELADRLGKLNGILHTQFSSPHDAVHFPHQAPPDGTPRAPLLVPASATSSASAIGSASASVLVTPEYIESAPIPPASMATVATELAHESSSVAMELSHGTGSVATETAHGTGSLATERVQGTSSLAMELAHRTGSLATELAHGTGSLATELAQGTGSLATELMHVTNSRNGLLVAAVFACCTLVLVALCLATWMQSLAFGVCVTGFQWFPSLRRSVEKQSDFLSDSGWAGNVGSAHEVWVRRA